MQKISFLLQKFTAVAIFLLLSYSVSFANEAPASENSAKFDAGKTITEHIADAHDWHIITINHEHISLPLPVIIYSSEKGFDVFLSSNLKHGAVYNGYKLEENKIVAVDEDGKVNEEATAKLFDVSITKNVLSIFITVALMLLIFLSAARMYSRNPDKAPKGIQSWVEPLIVFVRDDIAIASIGQKHYKRYLPYLLTIFFFIWISNLMGLIPFLPGGANVTGNIAVTLTLAVMTFLLTSFSANKNYWRHVIAMPGVPAWVLIILTPIEILGVFLRPFVLMIRLFANITAGHIIALSFFSLIFIFGEMSTGLGFGVSIVSVAFMVFMNTLELLVAFLQAYVFTLLSAIYFGAALEEHHHEEHAH
ncbi:MAG: F0F1 ATP synthase subunit A, partial [Bacteroidetes bacterium]|nr:F0F1 ATP synthase subunit A [Bacteroidota bacterium]